MHKNAIIRGYKRYPVHSTIKKSLLTNENEKVRTKFKPLDAGTVFKGKIRFHNLKKAEIGALLSALTFHGQSENCFHNIGMAKPLGYGKIKIELSMPNLAHTQQEYLDAFESEITKAIPNWKNAPQLTELFAMCKEDQTKDRFLIYQKLEKPNEFVNAKKAKEYLFPYSRFGNKQTGDSNRNSHQKHTGNRHQIHKKEPTVDDLIENFGSRKKAKKNRGLQIIKKKNKDR